MLEGAAVAALNANHVSGGSTASVVDASPAGTVLSQSAVGGCEGGAFVVTYTVSTGPVPQVVDSYGFETPDQGDGTWDFTYNPTGSVWTFTGGSGLSSPNGPWKCNSTSPDPLGNQFAYMQGTAVISKDLTGLAIGQTYELSFFESYRISHPSSGNDLSVIIDEGLPTAVVIYNNTSVTNATWQARTTSQFVAAKTSYTLTFRTTNPLGGDRTTLIDGVEVVNMP
jgi:hypothetical protein